MPLSPALSLRPRVVGFLFVTCLVFPGLARAAGIGARGEACAANPSGPGCGTLAAWCQDDRFVEADPVACKFAHGAAAAPITVGQLQRDCEDKPADGVCAVLLEACAGDVPESLRGQCSDARRWSSPKPPPEPERPARREEERDTDDDEDRPSSSAWRPPLGIRPGLGAWSADGTTLGAAELELSLPIVAALRLDGEAHVAGPLDASSAYFRGQGALRYSLLLGGLALSIGGGAGWDGTVMGSNPRVPGEAWALATAGLSFSLGGCMDLCDSDFALVMGVSGEARYVLGDATRSRVNRLADFDDTIGEVWLAFPLPLHPKLSLRSASQFTSATWTGLFLTLAL